MQIFFVLISLFSVCRANAQMEEIVLGVGSTHRVSVRGTGSISVSNGRSLKAEDLGSAIRLTGKKVGVSVISTDKQAWLVHILEPSTWSLYENMREQLSSMKGLTLEIKDGIPVISGRLLRVSDWKTLSHAAQTGGFYSFSAIPDIAIQSDARTMIESLIKDSGLPQADLHLSPAVVRLSTERADLALRFEKLLKPYGFTIEKSAGSLTLEPLVRVQILVTEIRKNFARQIGLKWPGYAKAQLIPKLAFTGSDDAGLSAEISALEDSGAMRILASPNLLARSGKEARFLAGGEFPIRVGGNKTQSILWKQYGVLLKIKPVADFSGRMSIALETEISTIDNANKVDGVPGMLTNRIESHFDIKGSRTIALSGLIKQESGTSSSGLPGLSSLPILGSLFSSKSFTENKTELVVFVTPEIVTDPGSEE